MLADEPADITDLWRDDFVTFLLGCSFSFEEALEAAGIPVRHNNEGKNVPMYVTTRECQPSGVFSGPLVVSMRRRVLTRPTRPRRAQLRYVPGGRCPLLRRSARP